MQREIDGLKLKRREVETSLQAVIAAVRNSLEFVHEQEQKERDDKILLHRPRANAPEAPGQAPATQAVMRALDAAAEAQKANG